MFLSPSDNLDIGHLSKRNAIIERGYFERTQGMKMQFAKSRFQKCLDFAGFLRC